MNVERPDLTRRDSAVPDIRRPEQAPSPLSVTLPDAASRTAGAQVSLPPSIPTTEMSLGQTPPKTDPAVQPAPTHDVPAPLEVAISTPPADATASANVPTSPDATHREITVFAEASSESKPHAASVAIPARSEPRKETTARVERPQDSSGGTEIIESEGKRLTINRMYPAELVDPVVSAIQDGIPASWDVVDPEGGVYENPETGQRIIVLPAESEEAARRDIGLARRVERALATEDAQARVAYQGNYAGVDAAPALAVHTDTTTGATIVAYNGRGGNLVSSTDAGTVRRVIEDLAVYLKGRPQIDASDITLTNIRIQEVDNGEEVIHIIGRGFRQIEPTPAVAKAAEPAPTKASAAPVEVQIPTPREEVSPAVKKALKQIPTQRTEPSEETVAEKTTPAKMAAKATPEKRTTTSTRADQTTNVRKTTGEPPTSSLPAEKTASQIKYDDDRAVILNAMRNHSGARAIAEATGIPERTVGRHLREIIGPQQEQRRTPQELEALERQIAAAINANPNIIRSRLAESLGLRRAALSKLEARARERGLVTAPEAIIGRPLDERTKNILEDFTERELDYYAVRSKYPDITPDRFSSILSELRDRFPQANIPYAPGYGSSTTEE